MNIVVRMLQHDVFEAIFEDLDNYDCFGNSKQMEIANNFWMSKIRLDFQFMTRCRQMEWECLSGFRQSKMKLSPQFISVTQNRCRAVHSIPAISTNKDAPLEGSSIWEYYTKNEHSMERISAWTSSCTCQRRSKERRFNGLNDELHGNIQYTQRKWEYELYWGQR